MSHTCCQSPRSTGRFPVNLWRKPVRKFWRKPPPKISGLFNWMIPGAMLALVPKCPMCLAAYIALATGAGISLAAASRLRSMMIIACTAWLLFFAARWFWRRAGRGRTIEVAAQ
jgi:hypothetical protein